MKSRPTAAVLLSTLATVGSVLSCSGGSTPASTCTYTLTGAVSASYSCEVVVATSTGGLVVSIIPTDARGAPVQGSTGYIRIGGTSFAPGTYNTGNTLEATIIVSSPPTAVWVTELNHVSKDDFPDQGTYTLDISDSGSQNAFGAYSIWSHVHGTLVSSLNPAKEQQGASGSVNVNVVFTDSLATPAGVTLPNNPTPDAGTTNDAGTNDAGTNDAGTNDAGTNDAGTNDAGTNDAGTNDDAGTPADGGVGTGGGCTMTYTGPIELVTPCTVSGMHSANSTTTNSVDIEPTGDATGRDATNFDSGGAVLGYKGDFATGTFTMVDPNPNGIQSTAGLQMKNQADWEEGFGPNSTTVGTFSYTVTTVGTPTDQGFGITTYAGLHGSFTGTMPSLSQPGGGTAADETLTISF